MYLEGLVLAGGASRRMGQDKLALPVKDSASKTIAAHVIDTVALVADHVSVLVPPDSIIVAPDNVIRRRNASDAVSNDQLGQAIDRGQISAVSDLGQFEGPLAAMAAAWPENVREGLVVVAAGDVPGLHETVLQTCVARYLCLASERQAAGLPADRAYGAEGVLIQRENVMQPLLGCYRAQVGSLLKDAVQKGERRLMSVVSRLRLDLIDAASEGWPDWWTRPVHTPDEYQAWLQYHSED